MPQFSSQGFCADDPSVAIFLWNLESLFYIKIIEFYWFIYYRSHLGMIYKNGIEITGNLFNSNLKWFNNSLILTTKSETVGLFNISLKCLILVDTVDGDAPFSSVFLFFGVKFEALLVLGRFCVCKKKEMNYTHKSYKTINIFAEMNL